MLKFLKKYWYIWMLVLIVNTFFIVSCTIRVEKDITTPGGLNEVKSLIEVENGNPIAGSISTIYVYSFERVTWMQSMLAGTNSVNDVSSSSETIRLSDQENQLSGQIMKTQSIETCLIWAYKMAEQTNPDIHLDYSVKGFIVYMYQINEKPLRVGDLIYQIDVLQEDGNYKTATTEKPLELADALNNKKKGDKIYYERNDVQNSFIVEENYNFDKMNYFYCYFKYSLDLANALPKVKLYPANTSGPSGGLMQTLSVYCQLTGIDLTKGKKVVGTGQINNNGSISKIGGVSQKIVTALRNNADVFLCPGENYDEAYATWLKQKNHEKMKLIRIETFEQAIKELGDLE